VELDEEGRIASIFDKERRKELVNAASRYRFADLIKVKHQQLFLGTQDYSAVTRGAVSISGESGPVSGRLVVKREGSPHAATEVVLYDRIKRIDLVEVVDLAKTEFAPYSEHSYAYFLPFPFDLSREELGVRIESSNGFLTPVRDYLPGASLGTFVSQHCVGLWDRRLGVTVANREASIVQFGELGAGSKRSFSPSEPTLISQLLMKQDQGKTRDLGVVTFPEVEPGAGPICRFEYAVTSGAGGAFDPVAATHFGWGFDVPLLAVEVRGRPGRPKEPSQSFFHLDKPNVILLDVKRADFGDRSDYILRLREIAGKARTVVTVTSAFEVKSAELANLIEEKLGELPVTPLRVPIGKNETLTLRLRLAPQ
jgi:hypothetical protein